MRCSPHFVQLRASCLPQASGSGRALGKEASDYNIVLEYTPTQKEFVDAFNKDDGAPIVAAHVFSHGFAPNGGREGGLNLGGRTPVPGEAPTQCPNGRQRRVTEVVRPEVQQRIRLRVTAFTSGSKPNSHDRRSVTFVPEVRGATKDFFPERAAIEQRMNDAERLRSTIARYMNSSEGRGLIGASRLESLAGSLRPGLRNNVGWLQRVLETGAYNVQGRNELLPRLQALTGARPASSR